MWLVYLNLCTFCICCHGSSSCVREKPLQTDTLNDPQQKTLGAQNIVMNKIFLRTNFTRQPYSWISHSHSIAQVWLFLKIAILDINGPWWVDLGMYMDIFILKTTKCVVCNFAVNNIHQNQENHIFFTSWLRISRQVEFVLGSSSFLYFSWNWGGMQLTLANSKSFFRVCQVAGAKLSKTKMLFSFSLGRKENIFFFVFGIV